MRRFGLIGYPLSHSFSKKYFTEKFQREGIDNCRYDNYPIDSINQLKELIQEPGLEGLNVTIPYKENVIAFLDERSEVVSKIQACNCIKLSNGKSYGYNTDVIGFELSLKKYLLPEHNKALILGTGGAAKAVAYVLETCGIEYTYVSRKSAINKSNHISYSEVTEDLITDHRLVINTTPLGMYPHTDAFPQLPYESLSPGHYLFDLIYNPEVTIFLKKGKERGAIVQNGLEMLIIQAEESWKIWNNK